MEHVRRDGFPPCAKRACEPAPLRSSLAAADSLDAPPQAVLIALITSYSARPTLPRLVPLALLFGTLAYALSSDSLVPPSTLSFLQTVTIPLSLSSKLPQIISNARAGSTGQLSAFLVFNSLAGCASFFCRASPLRLS